MNVYFKFAVSAWQHAHEGARELCACCLTLKICAKTHISEMPEL